MLISGFTEKYWGEVSFGCCVFDSVIFSDKFAFRYLFEVFVVCFWCSVSFFKCFICCVDSCWCMVDSGEVDGIVVGEEGICCDDAVVKDLVCLLVSCFDVDCCMVFCFDRPRVGIFDCVVVRECSE